MSAMWVNDYPANIDEFRRLMWITEREIQRGMLRTTNVVPHRAKNTKDPTDTIVGQCLPIIDPNYTLIMEIAMSVGRYGVV